jgi:hypothetical protein
MKYKSRAQAKRDSGIDYLGSVSQTTKHAKSIKYDELTYTLYLAPANMSGYEVCPFRTKECTDLCLNESGMNTMNMGNDMINRSRIKKTKLFFEHREFFVNWMIDEIKSAKAKADKLGFRFSIRLNNTSDITPVSFYTTIDGKKMNLMQIFPDIQFYDYTKVPNRFDLTKKYKNYDLTFSFSGHNMSDCITMLENKIKVAMVFKKVPETFMGHKVIDGDKYDMRYLDDPGVIVGLKFKRVRKKLDKENKFVIQ